MGDAPSPGPVPPLAPVDVVGLHGGQWYGARAEEALRRAEVLIGARRQLDLLPADLAGEAVELWGRLDEVLDLAERRRRAGQRVCILAAGDPGFFGLTRLASGRFGPDGLRVHPAPSSVALAFARVGVNWDDAVVASAHGRPLEPAVGTVMGHAKVAVLVSPDQPPEALGRALVEAGCGPRLVAVCSRLGEMDEVVTRTDLAGLAAGRFDPLSVVVLRAPEPEDVAVTTGGPGMGLAWGLPEADFEHRASRSGAGAGSERGMITKAEVRAVALGKLGLPPAGVLWDLGTGSGSVAAECARLRPGLSVYAVDSDPEAVSLARRNTAGLAVTVVEGRAPACLGSLPDPDRVFVGGGGTEVLEAALDRLRPGGVTVATYARLDRAGAAAARLGSVVQLSVARGSPLADGIRLRAENPVFVCWGPDR
ncbi:MAG TPA: precorrin-6y C5,15-methyltransferase (decarboxylating) subunit CbiE [Acidimicrobiales bacterium]|nr:precorrin-6y C5,15-methyltransferase (decarboxylating) subunit CbiE [Acidimicrobiales bacterium]